MMPATFRSALKFFFFSALLTFAGLTSKAYSILAHEAIIDASWKPVLIPLLKEKYPGITREEILMAHSYTYGGSIMADIGYMPFGNGFFTDLVHYVRSGDFIKALLADARNLNEYAFALGALSHYMSDKYGHSMSTNLNVPIIYPKLQKKFGNVVTYNDDHTSHSRMEFAYDVIQIGQKGYTSEGYHNFIGFNIAVPVLERAFYETYGLELGSIFSNINSSINTMRWGVRNLFPVLTKSAYKTNQTDIEKMNPGITARKFQYKMSKRAFNLEFSKQSQESKFFAKMTVFLIKILPKIGPLKTLKFKSPGEQGQKLFAQSFEATLKNYHIAVDQIGKNQLVLPDIDFDTGKPTHWGEYKLADNTYDKLLEELQEQKYKNVTPQLQKSILNFYSTADSTTLEKKRLKQWKKNSIRIKEMAALKPAP
ncbi:MULTISPECIES: zinc dependent phospholipase C family protein [unclassified Mucilaginibacter]|uniref:zinc dependent phospholipase C family protein n=1 Tax=unclassified Mucilaginibacter TaxID=2617802 RepID=UPI002AC99B47|nr:MULTISPECIES: zinc dependent phospholipase C family protein [unclassified Mucilaginibacter]MEB0262274.1 zinc dependent phospholipase C family protein [Mucilaginibacter sp. 10I4]MEB0277102.1 zinc dependent phospholipase C family protein [Mucilaginibacter sp. 10B2]MEB0301832.1 zinc dependent phospholipase C family protein [Mucilaginibacter sp. 5C4]WPX25202.1 zinc dependent phospholipase C family protein [Mucilaginibacter sp. 5C4]